MYHHSYALDWVQPLLGVHRFGVGLDPFSGCKSCSLGIGRLFLISRHQIREAGHKGDSLLKPLLKLSDGDICQERSPGVRRNHDSPPKLHLP